MFVGGPAIVRAHNHWVRDWTVLVTLVARAAGALAHVTSRRDVVAPTFPASL
jgi:hypothetical protein